MVLDDLQTNTYKMQELLKQDSKSNGNMWGFERGIRQQMYLDYVKSFGELG